MSENYRNNKQSFDWQEIINADESAFEDLYLSLYQGLFAAGYRFSADKELTKDCIQELFSEIWQKRFQLGHVKSVPAYLHTSLRRKIILKLQKKEKNRKADSAADTENSVPSYESLLINLQDDERQRKQLHEAISMLSPQQSEMLRLRFFEEMSYENIAHQTGKSRQTIYNQVFDAVKKLRKIMNAILVLF